MFACCTCGMSEGCSSRMSMVACGRGCLLVGKVIACESWNFEVTVIGADLGGPWSLKLLNGTAGWKLILKLHISHFCFVFFHFDFLGIKYSFVSILAGSL
jgi:hypothetical protein